MPIILLTDYDEVTDIKEDNNNFFEKNLQKLNINWWIKHMRLNSTSESSEILISFKKFDLYFLLIHNFKKNLFDRLKKFLLTFLRKVHNKIQ